MSEQTTCSRAARCFPNHWKKLSKVVIFRSFPTHSSRRRPASSWYTRVR